MSEVPASKKIYERFDVFREQVAAWAKVSEKAYHTLVTG